MKSMMKKKAAIALAAMMLAGSVLAADDTASFDVTASIEAQCVVGNTTNMAFGALDMLNTGSGGRSTADAMATTPATFKATCTNGTSSPTLSFFSDNGGGSAFGMKHSVTNDVIAYTLYEGTTDTVPIAYNTLAPFTDFTADGAVQSLSVTAKVLAAAKDGKPIGDYSDTVTITASFTP